MAIVCRFAMGLAMFMNGLLVNHTLRSWAGVSTEEVEGDSLWKKYELFTNDLFLFNKIIYFKFLFFCSTLNTVPFWGYWEAIEHWEGWMDASAQVVEIVTMKRISTREAGTILHLQGHLKYSSVLVVHAVWLHPDQLEIRDLWRFFKFLIPFHISIFLNATFHPPQIPGRFSILISCFSLFCHFHPLIG